MPIVPYDEAGPLYGIVWPNRISESVTPGAFSARAGSVVSAAAAPSRVRRVRRDYFKGFKDGLGDAADKTIVATATYEVSDPTVDSQILTLRDKGADVLFMTGIPKFNAMAIRKAFDIGWKPRLFFISSTGRSRQSGRTCSARI